MSQTYAIPICPQKPIKFTPYMKCIGPIANPKRKIDALCYVGISFNIVSANTRIKTIIYSVKFCKN